MSESLPLDLEARYRIMGGFLTRRQLVHGAGVWVTGPMIATPEAIGKLQLYAPLALDALEDPAGFRQSCERVGYYGDWPLYDVLLAVLARVPPPVALWALETCTFIGSGWTTHGFTGPWPSPQRPRLVVLAGARRDAAAVGVTIAHEIGHGWLDPSPGPAGILTALQEHRLLHETLDPDDAALSELLAARHADERATVLLAASWGFRAARYR